MRRRLRIPRDSSRSRSRVTLAPVLAATIAAGAVAACAPGPVGAGGGTAATPAPTATVSPSGAAPTGFVGTVAPVTAADVAHTWQPGCPVGPDQLRLLRLTYLGFDGQPHLGTLVVHQTVADAVVEVFRTLYRERFPIRRMTPVDVYGGSDERSMAADNTSGFNCRAAVNDGPTKWSAHAYGQAIDVNPVENPYLLGGQVLPPAGASYADRTTDRPGQALPGNVLVRAFEAAGWQWGGRWSDPDYQHFVWPGR